MLKISYTRTIKRFENRTKNHPNTDINNLHLGDDMIDLLESCTVKRVNLKKRNENILFDMTFNPRFDIYHKTVSIN